jgi:hypothetical protein
MVMAQPIPEIADPKYNHSRAASRGGGVATRNPVYLPEGGKGLNLPRFEIHATLLFTESSHLNPNSHLFVLPVPSRVAAATTTIDAHSSFSRRSTTAVVLVSRWQASASAPRLVGASYGPPDVFPDGDHPQANLLSLQETRASPTA